MVVAPDHVLDIGDTLFAGHGVGRAVAVEGGPVFERELDCLSHVVGRAPVPAGAPFVVSDLVDGAEPARVVMEGKAAALAGARCVGSHDWCIEDVGRVLLVQVRQRPAVDPDGAGEMGVHDREPVRSLER